MCVLTWPVFWLKKVLSLSFLKGCQPYQIKAMPLRLIEPSLKPYLQMPSHCESGLGGYTLQCYVGNHHWCHCCHHYNCLWHHNFCHVYFIRKVRTWQTSLVSSQKELLHDFSVVLRIQPRALHTLVKVLCCWATPLALICFDIAQDNPKLVSFLPPEYWEYRHACTTMPGQRELLKTSIQVELDLLHRYTLLRNSQAVIGEIYTQNPGFCNSEICVLSTTTRSCDPECTLQCQEASWELSKEGPSSGFAE